MTKLILHGHKLSPCVRSVLIVAEAIGLTDDQLKFNLINLFNSEHLTKEFLSMNPVHSVPVLECDEGYIIDSHAITTYLVTKYAKNDKLYPKDPFKRALVDQRLHFDSGILYIRLRNVSMGIYHDKSTEIPKERIDTVYEGFEFMEKFLENDLYLAGNSLTLADLQCVCTVTSCFGFAPISEERFPKLFNWLKRMYELPYYERGNGIENLAYVNFLKDTLRKKKEAQMKGSGFNIFHFNDHSELNS
ncbi:glutathione S-transferase 1 [Condylostylus longicornis]|uniref:glutathione S-transferase 1 n=1 Tax=Condylostylus longicornis TaxID=2530218 RepID=UPI00244DFE2C|nr:glutathione S-transferase 1 [Condylostylus longicornis]